MTTIQCAICAEKIGALPIEPCGICKSWLDKFTGQPEIKEAGRISELVAENVSLKNELIRLRARLTAARIEKNWDETSRHQRRS